MKNPKYFICPMSKNIVDSIIELNSELFGLIPTRRQIDFDGGYVVPEIALQKIEYLYSYGYGYNFEFEKHLIDLKNI